MDVMQRFALMENTVNRLLDFAYSLGALLAVFAVTYWAFWHFSRTVANAAIAGRHVSAMAPVEVGNVFTAIAAFMLSAAFFIFIYRRVICRLSL